MKPVARRCCGGNAKTTLRYSLVFFVATLEILGFIEMSSSSFYWRSPFKSAILVFNPNFLLPRIKVMRCVSHTLFFWTFVCVSAFYILKTSKKKNISVFAAFSPLGFSQSSCAVCVFCTCVKTRSISDQKFFTRDLFYMSCAAWEGVHFPTFT